MARIPNAFYYDGLAIDNPIPRNQLMGKPLCLLEFNGPETGIIIRHETCELLQQLDTPIVVVGVAGIYGSGKPYFMNIFTGKKIESELSFTVKSKTKRIWIWCRPHPEIENTTIVFVETEGLEDANYGNDKRDMQIIVLTLLLSSTFVYNIRERGWYDIVEQLGFVSELTKYIQVHAGQETEDDSDFDLYFPVLVINLRLVEFPIEEHSNLAEIYFKSSLDVNKDENDIATNSKKLKDKLRIKIRKYFLESKRHCFLLPRLDAKQECLANINILPRNYTTPEFLTKSTEYKKQIIPIISKKKTYGRTDRLNGRMFVDMVEYYVTALQSGRMPCIQSALKLTAEKENERLLHESVSQYEKKMLDLKFPLSLEELMFSHTKIVSDITKEFKAKLIFEESEHFRDEFQKKFEVAYNSTVLHNEERSRNKCERLLKSLNKIIEENILNKIYLCPGGYNNYVNDINNLKRSYNGNKRKGVKSEEVLHEFLHGKESEVNNIIAVDKETATVKIKEEEAERRLREEMLQNEIIAARNREKKLKETFYETFHEITIEMQNELEKLLDEEHQKLDNLLKDRRLTNDLIAFQLNQEMSNLRDELKPKPQRSSRRTCILS